MQLTWKEIHFSMALRINSGITRFRASASTRKKHHGEIKKNYFTFCNNLNLFCTIYDSRSLMVGGFNYCSRLLFNFTAPLEWVVSVPLFLGSFKYFCLFLSNVLCLFCVKFCIFQKFYKGIQILLTGQWIFFLLWRNFYSKYGL